MLKFVPILFYYLVVYLGVLKTFNLFLTIVMVKMLDFGLTFELNIFVFLSFLQLWVIKADLILRS